VKTVGLCEPGERVNRADDGRTRIGRHFGVVSGTNLSYGDPVPFLGDAAGTLIRPSLQRKQQEAEYLLKRLELLEKTLSVGKSVSNRLHVRLDVYEVVAEYRSIVEKIETSEDSYPSPL
jgi:hypothetical protein